MAQNFETRQQSPNPEQQIHGNVPFPHHHKYGRDGLPLPCRQRQITPWLWVGFAIVMTLALAFTLCELGIKLGIVQDPDFDIRPQNASSKHNDSWRITDSIPTSQMTDEQFKIYVGFVLWVTVELAGIGLEVFVWWHFVQIWNETRESLWLFAQFLFPLLVVTCIGLSLSMNYLALPFLVLGMWKFGFPETIMYMYLGLNNRHSSPLCRTADFFNGIGTACHHGAASFLVCMLLAGVIGPSRYIFNSALILVMQHWFVLLSSMSRFWYAVIELALELWFEWTVISDFWHLYDLQWTAALGSAVFLLAHWLFLFAAFLELFVKNDLASDESGSIIPKNVHQRGILAYHRRNIHLGGRNNSVSTSVGRASTDDIYELGIQEETGNCASRISV